MTLRLYLLGRRKGHKKVEVWKSVEEAQIHSTDGWSTVYGYNLESAIKKFEDNYKQLHSKKQVK